MNKIVFIYCIILLFCACTSIKNIGYTDYEQSIDLVYPVKNGLPVIDLSINNKKYYAIYDTRSQQNVICKSILNEIGIENVGDQTNITIPQIILSNGIILYNKNFYITETYDSVAKILFGLSMFNEYNVLVSYKQDKIFFYNSGKIPIFLNSWVPIEVAYPEYGLYTYGRVEGSQKTYLFCLSTGMTVFGGIFKRHYNIVLNTSLPIVTYFKHTITIGGKKYKNSYFFNSLSEISNDDKEKHDLNNTTIDIILGYEFFKKHDIFIDINNMKFYIGKP